MYAASGGELDPKRLKIPREAKEMKKIETICEKAVNNNPIQSHVAKEPATLVLKLCLWSEGDIAVAGLPNSDTSLSK
ncbi:hypothetical protein IQ224_01175 [Microcystis sp. LEGE 00066]|nr:hypothetical protein [Microcystis sp. LEGE 00066]